MRELTPQEIDSLAKTIKSAFDYPKLDRLLRLSTGDSLGDYVGPAVGLKQAVYTVLNQLNQDRVTDQLLKAVYRESVFNEELRNTIRAVLPGIDGSTQIRPLYALQKGGEDLGVNEGPGLQKVVKPSLVAVDAGTWYAKLGAILRQVCAVTANGAPIGTGFLVGEQAVLTNWHVAEQARKLGGGNAMACAFDYIRKADGSLAPSQTIDVEAILVERPCSPAELTADPDNPAPKPDELDYALLKLKRPLPERGYVRLVAGPPLIKGSPLYIVQHPEGKPSMIAQDTEAVIGLLHDGLRLRYNTNTDPGSSGSPCFTAEWDLVALHHLGDPKRKPPTYNQGVPTGLIRKSIVDAHEGSLLGP
ncbi:trypsin-like peptidase domain-containing protein [Methylocystis sp. H62]|uniref:trypsin-like serine peptidase n=1 Tax=Methylocystis sp. H62 TaxID=2785789 RepID=UPI0018C20878|nr:serine protease [Methylocystis sp. H62]MBG0793183.1 trypsin-like peptidase domain-containing protein [Methylocystis sp. H62]